MHDGYNIIIIVVVVVVVVRILYIVLWIGTAGFGPKCRGKRDEWAFVVMAKFRSKVANFVFDQKRITIKFVS